ncbi:MAG: 3-oxoacyl-ACP reductase FabG [Chloroflexi bacterium]|nr:3-oxoacyl-ACP reductase FabG [Chloroflexota bacterium]
MDLGLAGKTAIVTGGSSNIGRGIVLALAKEKANVIITYRDEKQARKTADDANALGGHALPIRTEVVERESVENMVKKALEAFGHIDILVNNVGGGNDGPFLVDKPYDEIEKEIRVNLWSVIHTCKSVSRHMIDRKYGRIINIGTDVARSGTARNPIYAASKAGVIGLTKSLARQMGQHNVTVNCVLPGWTLPEKPEDVGQGSFWYGDKARQIFSPEFLEKQVKGLPVRRTGTPRDIANMVVFFASDCASYITGQTIAVDGGAVME